MQLAKSDTYAVINGRLVLPDRVIEGGTLVVEKGLISGIFDPRGEAGTAGADRGAAGADMYRGGAGRETALPPGIEKIDAAGRWVTPGLMEVHIHGAGGVGFEALGAGGRKPAEALAEAAAFLRGRGITAFLPTLLADRVTIKALAAALKEAWADGNLDREAVPGIYVEGPFINPTRRGGIPDSLICVPSEKVLSAYLDAGDGLIRRMVYAPELDGAGRICAGLLSRGVIPSLGHSNALLGGFAAPDGVYSLTHLFNAMSPVSHKEPGLAMLPFICGGRAAAASAADGAAPAAERAADGSRPANRGFGRPYVEVVSDGVHVNDYALMMAARCIDPARLMLISDAAPVAGLPDGEYQFLGQKIVSGPRGVRYAQSDVLMGSRCLGPELLRHYLSVSGAPVHEAVRALTLNQRQLLGIEDRGALARGMKADFVVWDGNFEKAALTVSV